MAPEYVNRRTADGLEGSAICAFGNGAVRGTFQFGMDHSPRKGLAWTAGVGVRPGQAQSRWRAAFRGRSVRHEGDQDTRGTPGDLPGRPRLSRLKGWTAYESVYQGWSAACGSSGGLRSVRGGRP